VLEGEWPLIGRDDELARFGQLLAHPGTCGVVLGGDSGVGKTRLATECLRLCDAEGLRTVRISGTRSGSGLPLGAVAFLLPETPETLEYGPGELARYLREAAEAVVRGTDGRRLVLLVDDAHLLDDASAVLVNRLSVTGGAFVLATVTTGVEVPAVPDAVRSLWKDWAAVHLTLRGLSAARVADVLTTVLGGPVDPAAAGHLAEHAEGNMLFLRELILGAVEAGSLRDDGGIWRIVGPLSPSDRLKELVNDRLSRLNAHERLLLDVLAVGEPLGVAELESFGDRATVEMLEAKGLLQTRRNGHRLEVWLAHPVHGDVLRSQLGPLRASSLARELADALESTGARRRTDVMRIAMWRLEGGGTDPTVMIAGARTALFRHDLGLAERLALAALDAGGGFEAELLVAQLAALQGRGEEAEDRFAALTEAGADDQQRGPVAIARLDNLATYLGRLNDALRVAEEAETRIADQDWRDEIAARRAGILICLDGPSRALDAAEPVYRRGRGRAHIFACAITSHACGRLGRLQEALDAADHGARTELGVTGLFERASWIHAWWRGDALAYLGRVVEAEQLAQREYEQGLADRSPEAQAWFAWQLARRALERGHLEPAVRRALEALALFRELGRRSFEQAAGIHLALALGLQGKIVGAQQALTRLESLGPVVWMPVELL
jgi:tetratricopeptide (TPR) repeat protein